MGAAARPPRQSPASPGLVGHNSLSQSTSGSIMVVASTPPRKSCLVPCRISPVIKGRGPVLFTKVDLISHVSFPSSILVNNDPTDIRKQKSVMEMRKLIIAFFLSTSGRRDSKEAFSCIQQRKGPR